MKRFYQTMKSQFMLLLFITSVVANHLDSVPHNSGQVVAENEDYVCGPHSFSNNVKEAFLKEFDKDYLTTELYGLKNWVIILSDDFCNQDLADVVDLSNLEAYRLMQVVNGGWLLSFQSGELAYSVLSDWQKAGKLWGFYPEINEKVSLRYEPNDPYYVSGEQWYLDNYGQNNGTPGVDVDLQDAWDKYSGNGIRIAIVDNGLDYNNLDLSSNFVSSLSYDYCDGDNNVMPSDTDNDGEIDWHGTAVAGIASAQGNNSIGMSGVSYNSDLVGIRLIARTCSSDFTSDERKALALTHNLQDIDIYVNSWGPSDQGNVLGDIGPLALSALEKGVSEGRDGLGSVYVWAAGNGHQNGDNSNKDAYANSRYTVAVGSLNWKGERTDYSEPGANVMLVAPSSNNTYSSESTILSTDISGTDGNSSTDYLDFMNGTSASAPMVAGVISLMIEANPGLTWRDIQSILIQSSKKVDNSHEGWFKTYSGRDFNHHYGYGMVDATKAVELAERWQNLTVGMNLTDIKVNTGDIIVNEFISDENDLGVTSEYFVKESIDIETVEIKVNISHTWRGDLNLYLESPNGIVSELVRQSNDGGDHYRQWTFSSVVHWDENSFGTWKLKVNDTSIGGDAGNWVDWNMTFYGHPSLDSDSDGLTNFAERELGTSWNNPDWDNDGLLDGEEYYGWSDLQGNIHYTDLKDSDSDDDDVKDWHEGRENNATRSITNPNNNDTDGDGILDGCEIYGLDYCDNYVTNPLSLDTDGDGISDYDEIFANLLVPSKPRSDPTRLDTDNDGMPDPYELANGLHPKIKADGAQDSDCDGVLVQVQGLDCILLNENSKRYTNYQEYLMNTDPNNGDSDFDGLPDGWEYYSGLNPLFADSDLDLDNDTISNIREYNNYLVDAEIFSQSSPDLIAYWRFDTLSEVLALDSTFNANMAVMFNGPVKGPAKYDNGVYCDGVSSHLVTNSIYEEKLTEYTVHSWVKVSNYTDFGTIFGTVTDGRTWLGVDSEGFIQFRVFAGNNLYSTPLENDTKAILGVWYHIAATYSETDNSLRLYVNGTLATNTTISSSHSIKSAGSENYICRGQNGDYLNGTIDNIAVWARSFSEDEVRYFYERPLGIGNYFSFRVDDGIMYTNPNSIDTDGDGLSDREEFYFGFDGYLTDPTNIDTDGDGIDDYSEWSVYGTDPTTNDTDLDNFTDDIDVFPLDFSEWLDTDGDGVGDNLDFFPFDYNESQDSDLDGLGNKLEILMGTDPFFNDTDGDGSIDSIDKFPLNSSEFLDSDGDGYGDNFDKCPYNKIGYLDSDSDGYCDNSDAFPLNPNEYLDSDGDGYGDNSDKYPNDPSKYSDPVLNIENTDPLGEGTLDRALPFIILVGTVYFIFKFFRK